MRTTAAPVCRGVCIISDNALAGWSVLLGKTKGAAIHSIACNMVSAT